MPSLGASDLAPHVSFPQQSNPLSLSTDGQNPRNGESQPTRDIAKSPNPKREIESHNAGKYPDASRYEVSYGDGVFVNGTPSRNASQLTPEGDVVLNFSDADVRQFAQSVLGDILGANFVVDSEVSNKITLRTNRPIPKTAVIPAVETTLAAAGVALTRDGALYRIVPQSKAKASGVPTVVSSRGRPPPGFGVTAVVLNHVSASQMAHVLEPLAPDNSILRIDDARNLLMLAGNGPEIQTLLDTVDMFDIDALRGMSFGYFRVGNAKASELATELQSVMKAHAAQSGMDVPQIVPINRVNAILIIASRPRTLDLAKEWVARLDKGGDQTTRKLFVYRLKNRNASEISSVLNKIFHGGNQAMSAATSPKLQDAIAPDTPIAEISSQGTMPIRVASAQAGSETATDVPTDSGADSMQVPGVRIVADEENNALLIRATQPEYSTILDAIDRLDVVPPLVMIEVTIAEVTLNDGLRYGIEWFLKEKQSKFSFSSLDTGAILSKFPGFSYFFAAQDIAAVVNAMSSITDVRVVSSPRVMVRDNKTATLQVGDQVPVVTSTSQSVVTSDAPIIQTVQYFDTGVILKVTPRVNSGGLVTLDINQQVSDVADKTGNNVTSPTIQQRKIDSSIAIQSGEAVVLGGLMRESRSKGGTGLPLVSDIPGLGEVFKTHDNSKARTELMVIITPHVVWGRSDARQITDELRQRMEDVVRSADAKERSAWTTWQK
ncbi:type II secretion system secretin GspD [Hyphomicrobium sp. ghe19]|uniref:type II secretion system secretin GspD n=1 Tax=Hyphomicrobium sp. ghe19 TaxID=2682968 RepID=UPI0030D16D3A